MTDTPTDTDERGFERTLAGLIGLASRAGIDIEGGWKCAIAGNGEEYWTSR